ncbi:phosphinothricin acetyltransferase [Chryseobacterium piscicola]|uniref:N-acetyltransferase n=1 Tax=Chryseobacterium piscicola TaxID=551459 RepID=A0A1N7LZV7_9FLAO|nr:GNAT family N-acetyltransferase [Chryseobacterium piscicola]PQA94851.1 N-acetyltransferase [Chryseobacterium piscicola]SIS79380.1 phosphinothricin acetyltransferase [Chryseobacterium piscicola]
MYYELREMRPGDEKRVLEIFQQGIDSKIVTFETTVPTEEAWDMEFFNNCRWILENEKSEVIGWCALKPTSKRDCFSGVAEISIYFDNQYHGMGLGSMLLKKLIADSEEHGFWTLQANIFPENEISIKFHQKFGFRIVGTRKKLGKLHGEWKDVVMLERRSEAIF